MSTWPRYFSKDTSEPSGALTVKSYTDFPVVDRVESLAPASASAGAAEAMVANPPTAVVDAAATTAAKPAVLGTACCDHAVQREKRRLRCATAVTMMRRQTNIEGGGSGEWKCVSVRARAPTLST